MVEESKLQKFCSLYVNEMHLIVMIIPYIESELEKGRKVVTVLENSLEDEMKIFLNKVNLGKTKKTKIKKIIRLVGLSGFFYIFAPYYEE